MAKAAKPRPPGGDFSKGRNAADLFLRTAQRHHVQVRVMAAVFAAARALM